MGDESPSEQAAPPKRLAPTKESIRHLFAHSGNTCAFAGCRHPLIDIHGNFVAEICHIEAAELGGERFNALMTNEQRRHRNNLLLMCHKHHVETNDVTVWTVERMREIKAAHERRFEEAVSRIAESAITDITKELAVGVPQTLTRFGAFLNEGQSWTLGPEELHGTLTESVLPLLERLRKLAPDTRAVLLIVLERGEDYETDVGLPVHEMEQATGLGPEVLRPHIDTLSRYRVAAISEDWDGREWVVTHDLDGWPFWRVLKEYCEATDFELRSFVLDLRFDLLD